MSTSKLFHPEIKIEEPRLAYDHHLRDSFTLGTSKCGTMGNSNIAYSYKL